MMRSKTTERFRKCFNRLPSQIQRQARTSYQQFKENPQHPSLRFKPVHNSQPIYSVRVNRQYRALSIKDGDTLIWFWIGDHEDYDALLKQF
jgi:plasmid maintenance system killer protein